MWKQLQARLKSEKAVQGVVVLGLLGMLCILASSCSSKPKETDTQQTNHSSEDSVLAAAAYCTELEEQLEQTLSTIQGVGTCDVMITLRSTSIYQYAKDESRSDSSDRVEFDWEWNIGTRSGAVHSISGDSRRGNCLRWGRECCCKRTSLSGGSSYLAN